MEAQLLREDERFAATVRADTLPSADPIHCKWKAEDAPRLAPAQPVFKRCNQKAVEAFRSEVTAAAAAAMDGR